MDINVASPVGSGFVLDRCEALPALIGRHEDFLIVAGLGGTASDVGAVAGDAAHVYSLAGAMGAPSAEDAARGFLAVAVEQMAGAIRRISTERGFDPREHALVAFGGAAGQVACDVAEALGIREVIAPAYASVLSAWGIGRARLRTLRAAGLGGA